MSKIMNTGLFGGTFNPFHYGHIKTIRYVAEQFFLDSVIFIPASIPPHKDRKNLAPPEDRFQMVNESIKELPKQPFRFTASDIELLRSGPSYSIDTVNEFNKDRNPDDRLFFILGSDAFFEIHTWKNFKDIFTKTAFIIMIRGRSFQQTIFGIKSYIKEKIARSYQFDDISEKFIHETKNEIFIARVPRINISSTMIRNRIKKGLSVKQFTPPAAERIIMEKGLYR